MTDVDLAIIGGGFWGAACALLARERGIDHILLDDLAPWASSRNAAGMVHPDWFRGGTIAKLVPASWTGVEIGHGLAWLTKYGLEQVDETFRNNGKERIRRDVLMMPDPHAFLDSANPMQANVTHLKRDPKRKIWGIYGDYGASTDLSVIDARRVILAAGVQTDNLLRNSGMQPLGVERLRGRGIIFTSRFLEDPHVRLPLTVQYAPYKQVTIREWPHRLHAHQTNGRVARIGDTVEPAGGKTGALAALREKLMGIVGEVTEMEIQCGDRPVLPQFTVTKIAPALVVATGGHRVGLGVAPTAARRALEMLA